MHLKHTLHHFSRLTNTTLSDLRALPNQITTWFAHNPQSAVYFAAHVAAPPLVIAATPVALGIIGFGTAGVIAGTLAAGVHAATGDVVAGSTFALLQSAGAGGAGLAVVQGVAGAGAAVGSMVSGVMMVVRRDVGGGHLEEGKSKKEGKEERIVSDKREEVPLKSKL